MKVLLDTNIIVDIALERQPYFNEAALALALSANFRDFEDAIQYSTAVINQLDAIVTRNPQDFTNVTLRIFTPTQLIQELEL